MTSALTDLPRDGIAVTYSLTVADVNRSAEFYSRIFDAPIVRAGHPSIVQIANSWVILNVSGGPTDDKPSVWLRPPRDPDAVSAFMNIRVGDIASRYAAWQARGARFLTEPKDHGSEIRCYMQDPDGYLVEVGQLKRG
jgi:lactoylglutathione lyase